MDASRTVRPLSPDELARIFHETDYSDELRAELIDPIELLRESIRDKPASWEMVFLIYGASAACSLVAVYYFIAWIAA